MGDYVKLASRAAFRKGISRYCGFENIVTPGMWAGGIVGVKSILGVKSRNKALEKLERLNFPYYNDCSKVYYIEPQGDKEIRGPCKRVGDITPVWFPYVEAD